MLCYKVFCLSTVNSFMLYYLEVGSLSTLVAAYSGLNHFLAIIISMIKLTKPVETIWGRRTLFTLAKQPLLVNEIFLPVITEGE